MQTSIVELAEGRLYALCNPYRLDGRVSSHPIDARGFASNNCYLVVESEHAILIDTGFSVHEQVLLEQLDSLLEPFLPLSVWALRIGEFASICNMRPVVERFSVDVPYGPPGSKPTEWVDFRPEFAPYGTETGSGALGEIVDAMVRPGDIVKVGERGRSLLTLDAPLRLLPTSWAYDQETRTLFTADAFTYAWRPSSAGPWVITAEDDPTTSDQVTEYLLGSRFWWLAGARTQELREGIRDVFRNFEIETIAPAFGCIMRGRALVQRHAAMLDEILARVTEMPSIGLRVGRWRLDTGRVV